MSAEKILVVDDEKLIRWSLRERLEREGYDVVEAEDGRSARDQLDGEFFDLVLLDYRLPDATGTELLQGIREKLPDTAVIMMTAFSSIGGAVEAIRLGAYDYLTKPFNHEEVARSVRKALETTALRRELRALRAQQQEEFGLDNIIGQSNAMQEVFRMIRKVAHSAASTVLIQGPSGTGKDLVAKAIHYSSERAGRRFVNITCSALPEALLESELMGHERGAFTDARAQKKGMFELADGGTVFLDEIGEMGMGLQSKLLRFLEEKAFRRVGGTQDIRVDVRVVAATNVELERAVRERRFREDLFYRLNVIPIRLPSLAERSDDIPHLVRFFIDKFNREFRRNTRGMRRDALDRLTAYGWPGNVRELRNVIERAMLLEDKAELGLDDLPHAIVQPLDAARPIDDQFQLPPGGVSLAALERSLLTQALSRTHDNQTRAAQLLGLTRDTLRYRMKKYGLL